MERLKRRLEHRAIGLAVLGAAGFCVMLFLAVACYFSLLGPFGPAGAAALTALSGALVIGLVLLVTRSGTPGPAAGAGTPGRDPADRIEALLEEQADPVLRAWVRDNPDRALVTTLVLGVAAGYSESVRRVLADLYSQYAKSEAGRRRG